MRELRELPNETGFRFIGIDYDGVEISCVVVIDSIGCHGVENFLTHEPCFMKLAGWMSAKDDTPVSSAIIHEANGLLKARVKELEAELATRKSCDFCKHNSGNCVADTKEPCDDYEDYGLNPTGGAK